MAAPERNLATGDRTPRRRRPASADLFIQATGPGTVDADVNLRTPRRSALRDSFSAARCSPAPPHGLSGSLAGLANNGELHLGQEIRHIDQLPWQAVVRLVVEPEAAHGPAEGRDKATQVHVKLRCAARSLRIILFHDLHAPGARLQARSPRRSG